MNIAIPGIQGSFHHMVANNFYGKNITLTECNSFKEIPKLITQNVVDGAVMAIETSSDSAILPNYHLIDTNNLSINGEVYLPMTHNLIALPGQKLEDITEVWAHPLAIRHCHKFFRNHPNIKVIEEKQTAIVAKQINRDQLKETAVVSSKKAAEIYGLEILVNKIHTDHSNMTRYFVLNKKRHHHADDYLNNKASIKVVAHHKPGGLLEILTIFAKHKLNLSKILSVPLINNPKNFSFFIDLTFDDYHEYCKAMLTLETRVKELKILGEYAEGKPLLNLFP